MSDWVEHDGERFPVREGELVEVVARGQTGIMRDTFIARSCQPAWYRCNFMTISRPGYYVPLIVRYRIVRPPSLQLLVDLAANPPALQDEPVPA